MRYRVRRVDNNNVVWTQPHESQEKFEFSHTDGWLRIWMGGIIQGVFPSPYFYLVNESN